MTDPNTRGKVRRAHERREQSGDTEGLHMDYELPVEQLLPCDLCGGKVELGYHCGVRYAECTNEDCAQQGPLEWTDEAAIAAWNAHQQPGPSDGLAGELAQMIADTKNEQDNIEYYSGGSQRNQSAERLLAKVLERHEAILAALTTREAVVEECAKVAHCHSDDRPRRDNMDWNDGYQD